MTVEEHEPGTADPQGVAPVPRVLFQVAMVVPDLDAAMDELTRAVGYHWTPPLIRQLGESRIRTSFSNEGPPHIELIEGDATGPWSTAGGPRLDHLGFWSPDIESDRTRLAREGFELVVDGTQLSGPWLYYGTEHAGGRLEMLDESLTGHFVQLVARTSSPVPPDQTTP